MSAGQIVVLFLVLCCVPMFPELIYVFARGIRWAMMKMRLLDREENPLERSYRLMRGRCGHCDDVLVEPDLRRCAKCGTRFEG